jgi:hypothetical protein
MRDNKRQKEIRQILSNYVPYEQGELLRKELETIAESRYHPKHMPSHMLEFMEKHGDGLALDKVHPQSNASPYVWCLFTCFSQNVYGDCLLEVFDKAMKPGWKRWSED